MEASTKLVTPDMTVDQVLKLYPAAKAVMTKYGLDTCCGGRRKLSESARVAGADLAKLMGELTATATA